MPDADPVTAHLAWLAWKGRAPSTIKARRRALRRMAQWLDRYHERCLESGSQATLLAPGESCRGKIAELESPPGLRVPVAVGRMHSPAALLDATAADLAAWRAALTVAPNTVVLYASHARGFYGWAARTGLIETDPARGLPLPRLVRGLPRPVGEETLMEAVATAPPRIRPWLVLAGWAGLRAKEIALLRRDRVLDTASPPVLLVAADATKGHRERVVPMSGFVLAELRVAGLPRTGWVFPRLDGGRGPNAPHTISHLAARHLRACGTTASLHALRHRFGTVLYRESGHDLRLVQEMMGHADPATTAGYAAFDQSAAITAVEALPVPPRLHAVLPAEEEAGL